MFSFFYLHITEDARMFFRPSQMYIRKLILYIRILAKLRYFSTVKRLSFKLQHSCELGKNLKQNSIARKCVPTGAWRFSWWTYMWFTKHKLKLLCKFPSDVIMPCIKEDVKNGMVLRCTPMYKGK